MIPDQSGVSQTLYVGLYAIAIQASGKQNNCMHVWIVSTFLIEKKSMCAPLGQDFLPVPV